MKRSLLSLPLVYAEENYHRKNKFLTNYDRRVRRFT